MEELLSAYPIIAQLGLWIGGALIGTLAMKLYA